MKNIVYPAFFAAMTMGNSPSILLIDPSNPNSPKKSHCSSSSLLLVLSAMIHQSSATAIGKSKLVPLLRISLGERFNMNLRFGISTPEFLNAALMRSLDSLITASGSQIISIVGRDLFVSTSMVISCPTKPCMAYVFIL